MSEGAALQDWLVALGFEGDPEMAATGDRFTEFLRDWVPRGDRPELSLCAATSTQGPVAIRDLAFHSLCAHHLLPFFGTASVAYRPGAKLAGLGSVPRMLRWCAHRPQLQERLTDGLADLLFEALEPRGLVVTTRARHLCVEMRGAEAAADVRVVAVRGEVDDALYRMVEV